MPLSIYQKAKKLQRDISQIKHKTSAEILAEQNRILEQLKNNLPQGHNRKENEPCQKSQFQFNVIT